MVHGSCKGCIGCLFTVSVVMFLMNSFVCLALLAFLTSFCCHPASPGSALLLLEILFACSLIHASNMAFDAEMQKKAHTKVLLA